MSLREVSYSSRYGGSVVLIFELADVPTPNNDHVPQDDFEYEFGVGREYAIDVRQLTLKIFVTPVASALNPIASSAYWSCGSVSSCPSAPTAIEIESKDATVYKSKFPTTGVTAWVPVTGDEASQILTSTFPAVAAKMKSTYWGMRPAPFLYAEAFIHDQHQGLIAADDKVTKLFITDNFADLVTEKYQPYVMATWKLKHISGDKDWADASADSEWGIVAQVIYVDNDGNQYDAVVHRFEMTDTRQGPSLVIFAGTVEECKKLDHITVRMTATEFDRWSPDDHYDAVSDDIVLNCSTKIEPQSLKPYPNYVGYVDGGIDGEGAGQYSPGKIAGEDQLSGASLYAQWQATIRIVAR